MSDSTADALLDREGPGRRPMTPREMRRLATRTIARVGIVIPFAVTFATLAIASDSFRRFENLSNILDQQSAIIIVASAATLVLIAGGIDLSVGAVYGLAGAMSTQLVPSLGVPGAVLMGIGFGLAVGLVNGVLITRFKINALIGTLAMTYVVGGVGALLTKGNLVVAFNHPEFQQLAASEFFGITSAAWIMIMVAVAMGILLARTTFGRYVYASGGNPTAARMAGVRVNWIRISTFVLSGGAAALAGTLDASRVLSAQSSEGGFLTFTVLAGVVVGGTSILGGEGAMWRTVVGCLFIGLVGNGFNLLGLDPFYQQITLGVILLLAVGIDAWSRRYDLG
jgi:ribose transport system permease protein